MEKNPTEMYGLDVRIVNKIHRIIEEESAEIAIERLLGYMEHFFWSDWIREKIGDLYYQVGNSVFAGRYWYYKENQNENEKNCINQYKESKGNSLMEITREQIGHEFRSPKKLSKNVREMLRYDLMEIEKTYGRIPDFAKNWYAHFKSEQKQEKQ